MLTDKRMNFKKIFALGNRLQLTASIAQHWHRSMGRIFEHPPNGLRFHFEEWMIKVKWWFGKGLNVKIQHRAIYQHFWLLKSIKTECSEMVVWNKQMNTKIRIDWKNLRFIKFGLCFNATDGIAYGMHLEYILTFLAIVLLHYLLSIFKCKNRWPKSYGRTFGSDWGIWNVLILI